MRSETKGFGTIVPEILSEVCEDPTYANSTYATFTDKSDLCVTRINLSVHLDLTHARFIYCISLLRAGHSNHLSRVLIRDLDKSHRIPEIRSYSNDVRRSENPCFKN